MKKVFLIALSALSSIGMISAQDCLTLFPTTKGAQLENKTYDGQSNLLLTTTYTVESAYQHPGSDNATLSFQSIDGSGNVVDQGNIETYCDDGNFYMKQLNRNIIPDCDGLVLQNIDMMGSFLDYSDTFDDTYPFDNTFKMDGAEFTLKDKETGEFKKVRVYNRNYEKNEKITVPAGDFHASKISFVVEVYDSKDKKTDRYKGIEWYSPRAGIVRSEIMDDNNSLQGYSVLSSWDKDWSVGSDDY